MESLNTHSFNIIASTKQKAIDNLTQLGNILLRFDLISSFDIFDSAKSNPAKIETVRLELVSNTNQKILIHTIEYLSKLQKDSKIIIDK